MKLNLKDIIPQLDGKPADDGMGKEVMVGKALSNILLGFKGGGKHKVYILAQKAATQDELDLDDADRALIKNILEADTTYPLLASGYILDLLAK